MPGFFSTDESFSVLWDAWNTKHMLLTGQSMARTDYIVYPFGVDFYHNQPVGYLWFAIKNFFYVLVTPVLSYNLMVIMNFFLTAFFTYLLVFYISGSRYAGIFSGIAFGFCPYMFARSWQHIGETFHWVVPLFLLSVFRLKNRNAFRDKSYVILSFILTSINFNDIYYSSIVFAAFLLYASLKWKRNKAYVTQLVILICISFILLLPQFFPIFKSVILARNSLPSAQNIYRRPFEDLLAQSARPLSYFLPAAVHPLFGKFTESFVGTALYGISFTEHTLYLGWTTLALAFLAFRKRASEKFYIGFFVLLTIVTWFFSQPPWWQIGPIKVFMPSFFMYKVLPMFRAYCRFGIMVMLAVAVLAGFGLKSVLEKFKGTKMKIAITVLLCGSLLFEFWNWPPFKVINVSEFPAAYEWLKNEPAGLVIAEYPLDVNGANETYKLFQTGHGHKIINATVTGTYAHGVSSSITKLSAPRTAGVLKWMGVRYVFVHARDYLNTELIDVTQDFHKIPDTPGLKLVKNFSTQECPEKDVKCVRDAGPIDVYEVTAPALMPEAGK